MSRIGKSIEIESRSVLPGAGVVVEWGKQRVTANGHRVTFQGEENILKSMVVMVPQLCKYTKSN